jgi:hypothetical protein
MRTLSVLTVVMILAPLAVARVWTSVYRCDEATPLAPVDANYPMVYRDIMVGTRLVIVVSSDTVEAWSGGLGLSWDDANEVILSARGFDPESWNYEGSCLEAAGSDAMVSDSVDDHGFGFWYNNDPWTAIPGAWFAFDYHADQVGLVDLSVYHLTDNPDSSAVPIETLSFTHVASRDLDGDGIVNFKDFASLAGLWQTPVVPDTGRSDAAFDLDADGRIDAGDLARFAEYWLERTDCGVSAGDPNGAPVMP